MSPTYQTGDRILANGAAYLGGRGPALGDPVVVTFPSTQTVIKRVVGLPGDVIEIRGGHLYRNGQPAGRTPRGMAMLGGETYDCFEQTLGDRAFLLLDRGAPGTRSTTPLTVPPGHIYVLGDSRSRSNDSTNPRIGTLPFESLRGRITGVWLAGERNVVCE